MRIIAGKWRSRRIETRKSMATRPTLDKVREAVFSSLGGMFDGGNFLDLYAGSGANGLEAISRGMDKAYLVDCSKEAIGSIKENIKALKAEDETDVFCMKDKKALQVFLEKGIKFDYVYLDPPYAKQINDEILQFLDEHQMVTPKGMVIIESDQNDHFEKEYVHLKYVQEKKYGMSRITYYRCEE